MQWNAFIWFGVCAAVAWGHRTLENRPHSPYAAPKRSELVSGDDVAYGGYQGLKSLGGSIGMADDLARPCGRRYYGGVEGQVLRELRKANDCDPLEENSLMADKPIRFGEVGTASERDLPEMQAPAIEDGGDAMSDIFGVKLNPPAARSVENLGADLDAPKVALPVAYYNEFYEDLLLDANKADVKRSGASSSSSCDCKIKNDLLDLGQQHFPRYLLNAVCQTERSANEYTPKCWRGFYCKPLEYKVKVLTFRTLIEPISPKDITLTWLPDDLRHLWKFKTVTVAAGCFCAKNDSQ